MGVDLYCDNLSFSCSYGYWNNIRMNIILATFDYIQFKFEKDEELYKNITDQENENYIGDYSNYNSYKNYLLEFIKAFSLSRITCNGIDKFIYLTTNLSYIDALIYFDIGGLYSLCNKTDCEGYYSVGNSIDICQLFDLIEPFIKKYDEYCHSSIYEINDIRIVTNIYLIFKQSATHNKKVSIC